MLRIGAAAARRHRPSMEDRWVAGDVGDATLVAVFDGHNGSDVAEHASAAVLQTARDALALGHQAAALWRHVFARIDSGARYSGSTATLLLVRDRELSAAWVGDSRAVLVSDLAFRVLTPDHRIERDDERRRCVDAGAELMPPYVMDPVSSSGLMMTRALGDAGLRHIGILAEPEVVSIELASSDVGVVVATDGLWDVVDNDDAAAMLRQHEPQDAADRLVEAVARRDGADNVTVVAVRW